MLIVFLFLSLFFNSSYVTLLNVVKGSGFPLGRHVWSELVGGANSPCRINKWGVLLLLVALFCHGVAAEKWSSCSVPDVLLVCASSAAAGGLDLGR